MVGVAVSKVGLVTYGDLSLDLLTHVVVAADLRMLDLDVGIELVELYDVLIKHSAQSLAHGVVEDDLDFLRGVEVEVRDLACVILVARSQSKDGKEHGKRENNRQNSSFHVEFPLFLFLFFFLYNRRPHESTVIIK